MRLSKELVERFSLAVILTLIVVLKSTDAFSCYVCDSKENIECTENLSDNSRLSPQDCRNITGAKYCIKTTGIFAGEFGTKRACAANDHGNYCKYITQPTGDREYRSCVLTCDSENCNAATSLFSNHTTPYLVLFFILLSMILST